MSRDPQTNSNLPPWLRDVPLPPRPPQSGLPFAAPADAGAEPVPDWLRDMGAETASAPGAAPLPSWLRDDDSPAPAAAPAPESEHLPDWLRSLAADEPAPASSPPAAMPDWLGEPTPAAERSEPDWLRPDADASPADDTPDWLRDVADTPPRAATPAADDMPDWLRPTPSEPSPVAPADDTPDWLRPTPSEPSPVAPADDTPDWLRPTPSEPSPVAPADDTPDWLRPTPSEPSPVAPADDTPDWLRPTPSEPSPVAPADDTPDWLRPAAEASPAADDTPDWLSPMAETGGVDLTSDINVTPFSLDMIDETPAAPVADQRSPAQTPAGPPPWLSEQSDQADSAPPWLSSADRPAADDPDDVAPPWLQAPDQDRAPAPRGAASDAVPDWLGSEAAPAPAADIPPWLQDVAPATPEAPPAADIPPWLQDVAPATPEAPPAPAAPEAPPAADIPPWLQDVAPAQGAADLPDWLRADIPAAPAAPDTGPEAGPLPDWLREDAPNAGQPAAEPPLTIPDWLREPAADQPPAIVPVAIPDWLRDDPPSDEPGAPPRPSGDAPDTLPAWLKADLPVAEPSTTQDLPPWLRDERGQPLPTAVAPGEAGLPEWLRGAPAEARATPPPPPADSPTRPGMGWFDEEEPAPVPDSGLLGGTELPAWLKAETDAKPDTGAVDTRTIDWLTRLGVQEEEPAATAPAPAIRVAPPRTPTRSPAQIEAAALLRRLVANPLPDIAPRPDATRGGILQRIGLERALSLILLVALVVALAVPSLSAGLRAAPSAAGATALFQQIDQLGEDDVVLVGYEWDSRRASELRPLEQAVIGHLMDRNVKLVLVSTDPQGSLLLFDLRDQLTAAGYAQNGEGYLLLGYKPGGELALRGMAQNFESTLRSDFRGNDATVSVLVNGLETGRPLNTLRDFSMIVVMADDAPDVQAWMEQIRPPTEATSDAAGIPMAFLLPSEAAPIIQPYVVQRDVLHLAGQTGALAYRSQSGTADEQVAVQTGQLRLSALIFVGLLLAGSVAAAIIAAVERRRGAA